MSSVCWPCWVHALKRLEDTFCALDFYFYYFSCLLCIVVVLVVVVIIVAAAVNVAVAVAGNYEC